MRQEDRTAGGTPLSSRQSSGVADEVDPFRPDATYGDVSGLLDETATTEGLPKAAHDIWLHLAHGEPVAGEFPETDRALDVLRRHTIVDKGGGRSHSDRVTLETAAERFVEAFVGPMSRGRARDARPRKTTRRRA
jgi:hypothetical protein